MKVFGRKSNMIFHFSLYGFLKNQKYFEPFLVLAFLEKGLSFTLIGMLIGFRGICINLLEIPSGVIADLYGRRKAMLLSFCCYIFSFILFGVVDQIGWLFMAMLLFSTGEAFRSGTHKAIIFEWLRAQNLLHQKTKVYGMTRSWAKVGSAVSVVIATLFILAWRAVHPHARYGDVFLLSVLPYLLGLINFLFYPRRIDGQIRHANIKNVSRHLLHHVTVSIKTPGLRSLFFESMSFDGLFKTVKDYLQPILKDLALSLPVLLFVHHDKQRATLVIGMTYLLLYLGSAVASRLSHKLSNKLGGEDQACRQILWATFALFCALTLMLYARWYSVVVVLFMLLQVFQDLWSPAMVSRFYRHASPETGATILSMRTQANSIYTFLAAPLAGLAIDRFAGGTNFWPVGVLGLMSLLPILIFKITRGNTAAHSPFRVKNGHAALKSPSHSE